MTDTQQQPRLVNGRYSNVPNSDADVELAPAVTWAPGMIHPTGGYDDINADDHGTTRYLLDGDLHREDGPALTLIDGTEEWYWEGVRHREGDEPSVISSTGETEYHQFGLLHRDNDKPAVLHPDGTFEHWVRGKRHRDGDRPALSSPDGQTEYWVNGERHRDPKNGPALIRADGSEMFFVHGRETQP
jgi:hypothetical protein